MSGDDPLGWVGNTLDERVAIQQLIGEGGFGYVYRGMHVGFEELVAVKCLKLPAQLKQDQRENFLRDFKKEARLLHKLSRRSSGIVQALDVGAATSPRGAWTPYIVMEWLEGHTLDQELDACARQGQYTRTVPEAVAMLSPVADALGTAHDAGIAHLDIKPSNLFIVDHGGEPTLKVLDFGIAKAISTNATIKRVMTQQGGSSAAFTPNYAAPEQFNVRHGKPGAHTDVFALGLILLELTSGMPPLEGDTPLQLYFAAANQHLRPSFEASGVETTPEVSAVLRKALAVEPAQRYPDAVAMWHALLEAVAGDEPQPSTRRQTGGRIEALTNRPQVRQMAPTAMATQQRTGQNRLCTVVAAQLVGTTKLSQMLDPEQLGAIVDQGLEAMGACIERAGGAIEDVTGEQLLASFGLHGEGEGAAERAIRAALAMQTALDKLAEKERSFRTVNLRARVGISTGLVFVRQAMTASSSRVNISGAPVALASHLAQVIPAKTVVMGRDTYRQVSGLFETDMFDIPLAADEELAVPKAYRVLGPASSGSLGGIVVEIDFHGAPTQLIGRAAELSRLRETAERVVDTPCAQLVSLLGHAGMGKSRMIAELAPALEELGFMVLTAHASSLEQGTSYGLAASLLRGSFHIHDDDPREVVSDKVARGIHALRQDPAITRPRTTTRRLSQIFDPEELNEQLMRALGFGLEGASGITADEQSTPIKHRIAGAFASLVGSTDRPIALICDDVHWADEASLALLDDLLMRLSTKPLFVVCAAQRGLMDRRPAWAVEDGVRQLIQVEALPRRRLAEMARDRLARVEGLPEQLIDELSERAEGYPLALVEMLHLLIDTGAVVVDGPESWRVSDESAIDLSTLPTTMKGLVQARLDRLDDSSRELLGKAAVIGRHFWDGALSHIDGSGDAHVATQLGALCERGLLRRSRTTTFPGETEFLFAEGATREVAYDMLGHAARRELHELTAEWLAKRSSSDASAALLARHYERAACLIEALDAYGRAGRYAAGLGQNIEAVACFDRARRIDNWLSGDQDLDGDTGELFIGYAPKSDNRVTNWPDRVRMRVELGDVLRRMGELASANTTYEDARACIVRDERRKTSPIDPFEAPRWDARIDFRLALVKDIVGDTSAARELVLRAISHAEQAELVEEQAQMFALLAAVLIRAKQLAASLEASLCGLRVCRIATHRGAIWQSAVAWLLRTLGGALYHRGKMVRAERCYLQAARTIDDRRNPFEAARALNNVAAARFAQGKIEAARDSFRRVTELAERAGDLWMTMTALGNLGEVEHHLGRHTQGRTYLEEAVRLGEMIGARAELPELHRNLALVLSAAGELAAAVDSAERALDLVSDVGATEYLPQIALTVAEICARVTRAQQPALASELSARLQAMLGGGSLDSATVARCNELLRGSG